MVTPLDKRGEVDQLATEAVVKLIEAGVDGTRPWVASANSRTFQPQLGVPIPRPCVVSPCPPRRRCERGIEDTLRGARLPAAWEIR